MAGAAPAVLSPAPRCFPFPATVSRHRPRLTKKTEIWNKCRLKAEQICWVSSSGNADSGSGISRLPSCSFATMSAENASVSPDTFAGEKEVWIWTENKRVMTAAVERGWNTFLFSRRELADDWSSIAMIEPLFIQDGHVVDCENKKVASIFVISTPEELKSLHPDDGQLQNIVLDLQDWQIIPAENIVALFQGSQKTVLAISRAVSEARTFLEALELGLGGVIIKAEDVEAVVDLKDYFDRRYEVRSRLSLTKASVTQISTVGMGDRVCVDLCSLMKPGEGILVGSFARGLFLVHSECLESNYISSRPFRVNAGPVHSYVAVPGGRTCYLSELKAGKEVVVVDREGIQRTAIVGRVKIETRPLILVEAKVESLHDDTIYSIFLQNAETVALIPSSDKGNGMAGKSLPVTSLKVGDEILLRVQGGARHTGIEIREFIVEN